MSFKNKFEDYNIKYKEVIPGPGSYNTNIDNTRPKSADFRYISFSLV